MRGGQKALSVEPSLKRVELSQAELAVHPILEFACFWTTNDELLISRVDQRKDHSVVEIRFYFQDGRFCDYLSPIDFEEFGFIQGAKELIYGLFNNETLVLRNTKRDTVF